ncbi:OmpA family protein [Candidatus Parcubacteria bacterium]|nr:MAG: OmpA family protein [Candidatus Parcubacteria bacterium]
MSESNVLARKSPYGDESYFVSMTDLMVGVLFIFIILLMVMAMHFTRATEELTGANQTRTEILRELRRLLEQNGVRVIIDEDHGILRLPEEVLFDTAQAELNEQGRRAVRHLANAFLHVLPCYAWHPTLQSDRSCEGVAEHKIETIYIEGHTDKRPIRSTRFPDNWVLSAARARETYLALLEFAPELRAFRSGNPDEEGEANGLPLFSIAGYGATRPVPGAEGDDEESLRRNRRIDIRFVMVVPKPPEPGHVTSADPRSQGGR